MSSNQPDDPSNPKPTDGRMHSVFSTLREALRPGDAPRHGSNDTHEHDSSLSSGQPKQQIPLRQADRTHQQQRQDQTQQQLRGDYQPADQHPRAFPEAHRDATGHTTVLESIMPGNQGLSGKPAWDPKTDPSPPANRDRRGSGILGAIDSIRRRRSSATSSREEATGSGNGFGAGFRRSSFGSTGDGNNYTYDTFSGTRSSDASARPRASSADSGNMSVGGTGPTETMRDAADKLPGSVARESQVSR